MSVRLSNLNLPPGALVRIVSDNRTYECQGIVYQVKQNSTGPVLLVEDCKEIKTGYRENGIQDFDERDIDSIEVLSDVKASSEKVTSPSNPPSQPPSKPQLSTKRKVLARPSRSEHEENRHLKHLHSIDMEELLEQVQISPVKKLERGKQESFGISYLLPKPKQDTEHMEGKKFIGRQIPEFRVIREHFWSDMEMFPSLQMLPEKMFHIQDIETFENSIEYLKDHSILGVSLEGQYLGRQGKLSLISFATRKRVFVFDVVALGSECFEKGLKNILQDPNIVKVFHDVRLAADILHHQYNVEIDNIYDTLAAHALFVTWSVYCGFLPKYAHCYNNLVRGYLGIRGESLFFTHYRAHKEKSDSAIWMKRPLPDHLLLGAARNVMHLLELQKATRHCMNAPFVKATKCLQNYLKDVNAVDADIRRMDMALLPQSVIDSLPQLSPDGYKAEKITIVDEENRTVHQSLGQIDPKIIFSRDCIHQNSKTFYEYE